jgi:small conductance mechanosensitive channel
MNFSPEAVTTWLTSYSIKILGALLIFIVGRWLSAKIADLISRIVERHRVDPTLVPFLHNLIYYSLLVMVLIAAAGKLGINTTSFLTIVGAAGLAVGLALKDSLSNFASGVMLISFKPFRVGDVVTAGGTTGKVEKIAIFNTVMCTPDNQQIFVPNSKITSDTITNITAKATRRIDLVIGIGYGDDMGRAKQLLTDVVKADNRILVDPAPTVAVAELGDSSVNLVCRPWVNAEDYWDVRFQLIETIKNKLDEAGISIPFPQRDVHLFVEQGEVPAA